MLLYSMLCSIILNDTKVMLCLCLGVAICRSLFMRMTERDGKFRDCGKRVSLLCFLHYATPQRYF